MKYKTNITLKKNKVIQYIKNNHNCTRRDISRDTKIKLERIGWNLKDAYIHSKIKLSKSLKRRTKKQQKEIVTNFIRENPNCTISDLRWKTSVNVIRIFGSIKNAYRSAGIKYPKRKVTSGVMNPDVIRRCLNFEKKIINYLKTIGKVKPKIRTKTGIVDCLFLYQGKEYVVEVKDYRGQNNITMHELKQLFRYMKELNIQYGILICPESSLPKRKNKLLIKKNNFMIHIVSNKKLGKIRSGNAGI